MIEIMDTTLRDGEQTDGVSFNVDEKTAIASLLLEELRVNRIEVVSARVSKGERAAFEHICSWAQANNCIDRVEALGFVDGTLSVDWITESGGKVLNLLTKGSLLHVTKQLRKTPEDHFSDISKVVNYAVSKGMIVNVYLEDWSNGMLNSEDYVYAMVDSLKSLPIKRFMLPDTLGVLNPWQTYELCKKMIDKFPGLHFDFHGHNDYDLGVANTMAAISAGVNGVHATVNGLGERSGNVPIASILGVLNDHLKVNNSLDESKITHVCKYVETISGIRIPANKPIVGENVFTQSSGVHADGDGKGKLYVNALLPERFGRVRKYALGKTSGKANIIENLNELGIKLTPEQVKLVTARVVELGDKKESMSTEDLPFIVADVLKSGESTNSDNIKIVNYCLQLAKGMKPVAIVKLRINGTDYESSAPGDGQYDAFMKAIWKIYEKLGKEHPLLADYVVNIPPGGKSDALVATTITWDNNGSYFKTRGIDSDQTEAAIKATVKMLNIWENIDTQVSQLKNC